MTDDSLSQKERSYLLGQVREAFGRVAYSHKTHEKQADISYRKHRWQQISLVVFTAISSGTFLASVLGVFIEPQVANLGTSFIALMVTAMSLATMTFRFDDEAERHRDVAARLWNLRESYLSLISDLLANATTLTDPRARRDELQAETYAVYTDAPRTTPKAYGRATAGLKHNEELTFTSSEIDLLLPEALRPNESGA